jgi:hypothetical protein
VRDGSNSRRGPAHPIRVVGADGPKRFIKIYYARDYDAVGMLGCNVHCSYYKVGCRGLMVKASGWQSFDRQFEPCLRAFMAAPLRCGLGWRSRTGGGIHRSRFTRSVALTAVAGLQCKTVAGLQCKTVAGLQCKTVAGLQSRCDRCSSMRRCKGCCAVAWTRAPFYYHDNQSV